VRLVPKSLAGQLVSLLLAALVVSQILTMVMFFGERDEAVRDAWRAEFAQRIASVARLADEAPPQLAEQFVAAAKSRKLTYSVGAAPAGDETMTTTEDDRELEILLAAALERDSIQGIRVVSSDELRKPPLPERLYDAVVDLVQGPPKPKEVDKAPAMLIAIPLSDGHWFNVELDGRSHGSRWALVPLASTLLTALATLIVVAWTVRRITRPLRNLAEATEGLGRGEAPVTLRPEGPEELRKVALAFNAMSERLTRFVKDRTRMLAAISHDLRTPITAMRVRAEFIDDEETRDHIIQTLDDMKNMTEATLSFARDEASTEETRVVDLSALVGSLVSDLEDLGHEVRFEDGEAMPVACRSASIKRAIANLLGNAVRYGARAHVRLAKTDHAVTVTIDDVGPGIPEERLTEVFEPFTRLEGSRSRETGGVGLGLAIARSIVLAHGGEITLENREQGGLRARVVLPL